MPATEPQALRGTFVHTRVTTTSRTPRGGATVVRQIISGTLAGSLVGSFREEVTRVEHPPDDATLGGLMTCACALGSLSGTLVLGFHGSEAIDGSFEGQFAVLSGTGGLATMRGWGRFQGTAQGGAYTGRFFFES